MPDTDTPLAELQAIAAFPIARAWACTGCSILANRPRCPYCLSENMAPVSGWLNRNAAQPDPERVEEG